jgi:hypothetical protein
LRIATTVNDFDSSYDDDDEDDDNNDVEDQLKKDQAAKIELLMKRVCITSMIIVIHY